VSRVLWLWLAVAAALAIGGAAARADNGVIVGVSDDSFLWNPIGSAQIARDLGITAFRVTLKWDGASRTLSDGDAGTIAATVAATSGLRMVVAIVGENADLAPQTDAQRDAYCSYATDLVQRFPSIRDVVIWNEVNLSYFWRPQFDSSGASAAPAAYEALLARCWDELHAAAPDVNVIADISSRGNDNPNARSNISHSPLNFIAHLGSAYRGSGRTRPIFDTFGEHPYASSSDYPWQQHDGSSEIAQGDLPRLLAGLDAAFAGTGQKAPGSCSGASCPTVWYLEAGYQTVPDADKAGLYSGFETEPSPVPDGDGTGVNGNGIPDQGMQIRDGISLADCQPGVGAFFNFLLQDEVDLAGWQSGVLWADGTPKASYSALKAVTAKVAAGQVDCNRIGAATTSTGSTPTSGAGGTSVIVGAPGGGSSGGGVSGGGSSATGGRTGGAPTSPAAKPKPHLPTPAAKRAVTYLEATLHLVGLRGVRSFRSHRNPRWFVVDGFYGRPGTGGAVAVWLQQTAHGLAVRGVARGRAVARARAGVPCDLAYAFDRSRCR
jgi:hypothetical protein